LEELARNFLEVAIVLHSWSVATGWTHFAFFNFALASIMVINRLVSADLAVDAMVCGISVLAESAASALYLFTSWLLE